VILQAVAPVAIVLAGVGYQVLHAGTDTFIRALPQGHDAELRGSGSRKGTHLSVRQQQFLALASVPVHYPAVCSSSTKPPP
jgi:ABC-type bacteriocin/lantibiotic exporter with double-glycine peptidase domain